MPHYPRTCGVYVERLCISHFFTQGIDEDTDGTATIYTNEAISNVLKEFGDSREDAHDINVDLKVFMDESGVAFPGYMVSSSSSCFG